MSVENPLLNNISEVLSFLSDDPGEEEYIRGVIIAKPTMFIPSRTGFMTTNPLINSEDKLEESFEKTLEKTITYIEWDRKPPIKWSTAYFNAGIDHNTAREIKRGNRVTKPSMLKLVITMQLDFKRAEHLLETANFKLNKSSWTDIIVANALVQGIYSRSIINDALMQKNAPPLFPNIL